MKLAYFVSLDRFFDHGRVQTTKVAVKAFNLFENILYYFLFMFTSKRTLYFRHSKLGETAETGVSDPRGRKTAELHKSGAKRAKTWQGEVKC